MLVSVLVKQSGCGAYGVSGGRSANGGANLSKPVYPRVLVGGMEVGRRN